MYDGDTQTQQDFRQFWVIMFVFVFIMSICRTMAARHQAQSLDRAAAESEAQRQHEEIAADAMRVATFARLREIAAISALQQTMQEQEQQQQHQHQQDAVAVAEDVETNRHHSRQYLYEMQQQHRFGGGGYPQAVVTNAHTDQIGEAVVGIAVDNLQRPPFAGAAATAAAGAGAVGTAAVVMMPGYAGAGAGGGGGGGDQQQQQAVLCDVCSSQPAAMLAVGPCGCLLHSSCLECARRSVTETSTCVACGATADVVIKLKK